MTRYVHRRETTLKAMQSQEVRRALAARARQIAARANGMGSAEGAPMDAKVVEGTRPKGRPFANVESPNTSQEWGSATNPRRRILGRAAGL